MVSYYFCIQLNTEIYRGDCDSAFYSSRKGKHFKVDLANLSQYLQAFNPTEVCASLHDVAPFFLLMQSYWHGPIAVILSQSAITTLTCSWMSDVSPSLSRGCTLIQNATVHGVLHWQFPRARENWVEETHIYWSNFLSFQDCSSIEMIDIGLACWISIRDADGGLTR